MESLFVIGCLMSVILSCFPVVIGSCGRAYPCHSEPDRYSVAKPGGVEESGVGNGRDILLSQPTRGSAVGPRAEPQLKTHFNPI